MSKPNTPEIIYLMDCGDGVVWCDDPAPGTDMEENDAVKYVRADYEQKVIEAVENIGNLHSNPALRNCTDMCHLIVIEAIKQVMADGE